MFLWPDPVDCSTPGVTRHPALKSADFPQPGQARPRSSDQPEDFYLTFKVMKSQTLMGNILNLIGSLRVAPNTTLKPKEPSHPWLPVFLWKAIIRILPGSGLFVWRRVMPLEARTFGGRTRDEIMGQSTRQNDPAC
jgi:hypothetical protein